MLYIPSCKYVSLISLSSNVAFSTICIGPQLASKLLNFNTLQMAKELDAILDQPEPAHAGSCTGGDGTVSFLAEIVTPIYETMAAVCVTSTTF